MLRDAAGEMQAAGVKDRRAGRPPHLRQPAVRHAGQDLQPDSSWSPEGESEFWKAPMLADGEQGKNFNNSCQEKMYEPSSFGKQIWNVILFFSINNPTNPLSF